MDLGRALDRDSAKFVHVIANVDEDGDLGLMPEVPHRRVFNSCETDSRFVEYKPEWRYVRRAVGVDSG
jgi:hypothetical protein